MREWELAEKSMLNSREQLFTIDLQLTADKHSLRFGRHSHPIGVLMSDVETGLYELTMLGAGVGRMSLCKP